MDSYKKGNEARAVIRAKKTKRELEALAFVEAHPGATSEELSNGLKCHVSTARKLLQGLRRAGLISPGDEHVKGNIPHYFATGPEQFYLDALERISEIHPKVLKRIEADNYIFSLPLHKSPENEAERWERLAFNLYSTLCTIDDLAREALSSAGGE